MSDFLSNWISEFRSKLEAEGFKVTLNKPHVGGSHSVNLDSSYVVGTVTHWPEEQFEFQFHSCETGEVLVIEEKSLSSVSDLNTYFEELRRNNLS